MKYISLLFIISIFISNCNKKELILPDEGPVTELTAGWSIQDAYSSSDIFFINPRVGFMGGQYLQRSLDSGKTWNIFSNTTLISSGINNVGVGSVQNACFVGASSAYQSSNPRLYFSKDTAKTFTIYNKDYFYDCFYTSADTCYVTAKNYIWKTKNGGETLDSVYKFPVAGRSYTTLFFLNSAKGWISSDSLLYSTQNGAADLTLLKTFSEPISVIQFVNESVGFVSTSKGVYKTTDSGINWVAIATETVQNTFIDIHFFNALNGYYSSNKSIYKTTDGGSTWNKVVTSSGDLGIIEMHFTDENHGWACTYTNKLLRYNK
jgi:photosystem II stability/assembly factor-like uncharacterized protein